MQDTKTAVADGQDQFVWKTQPVAARWVTRTIDSLAARNPVIDKLAGQLREYTGTRLIDWVDHIALNEDSALGLISELADVGYAQQIDADHSVWRHPLGMFPPVIVNSGRTGLALRCDCVNAARLALPPMLGLHPAEEIHRLRHRPLPRTEARIGEELLRAAERTSDLIDPPL